MSPFDAVSTKHREGLHTATQRGPLWLRGVWVISSRVPKGEGGPGHTVLTQAGLAESQEILPAVERQQKALTQLPTKAVSREPPAGAASTGSILGHTAGQTELQAPALGDGTWKMILSLLSTGLNITAFSSTALLTPPN